MAEKPEQGRLEELKRSLTNALPSLSPEQVERAAVAALSVPAADQEDELACPCSLSAPDDDGNQDLVVHPHCPVHADHGTRNRVNADDLVTRALLWFQDEYSKHFPQGGDAQDHNEAERAGMEAVVVALTEMVPCPYCDRDTPGFQRVDSAGHLERCGCDHGFYSPPPAAPEDESQHRLTPRQARLARDFIDEATYDRSLVGEEKELVVKLGLIESFPAPAAPSPDEDQRVTGAIRKALRSLSQDEFTAVGKADRAAEERIVQRAASAALASMPQALTPAVFKWEGEDRDGSWWIEIECDRFNEVDPFVCSIHCQTEEGDEGPVEALPTPSAEQAREMAAALLAVADRVDEANRRLASVPSEGENGG